MFPPSHLKHQNEISSSDPLVNNLKIPVVPLSELKKGEKAEVIKITEEYLNEKHTLPKGELERRLLEMGFVEGTELTIQHEGFVGKDPIAVLLRSCSLVAIRRKEAQAILVRKLN
ncbi:FeoA family protein [Pigmentibacter sp. JX0631]|uniref:FeoA family protein n=1 Tax=Pigmentibacter sp. JX0631 TaxID=2976982 RepID=UPI0024692841|nr:FeoA family protein [Pigmentibacter sp. JX0631]WGL59245.1 FeoA family protein [Pigmentibacter sp. JX0631]